MSITYYTCTCKHLPLPSAYLLNSSAVSSEPHVIRGTAFMAMYQTSLSMGSNVSWKPRDSDVFSAITTLSSAHSARDASVTYN